MKNSDAVVVALLAGIGVFAWWITRPRAAAATVGPVEHVGEIGNTDPAKSSEAIELRKGALYLCQGAPVNSFGAKCEGLTWRMGPDHVPVMIPRSQQHI